jgi:hypothetical protein
MRPELRLSHHTGEHRYVAWRSGRLREAGFDSQTAERLATDPRFDLHALLGLIDRGCPPRLAARIAAPLDWDEHA